MRTYRGDNIAKASKSSKRSKKSESVSKQKTPTLEQVAAAAPQKTEQGEVAVVTKAGEENKILHFLKSHFSIYTIAIGAVIAVMLYIRIALPYNTVFTSWPGNYINIAADDAPEQMRMVYNTLAHFPLRELYDPFTHYPYGSLVHFGPLFTMMIAVPSLILGLGHPSTQLTATVGAFVPAILGALCAIPTYYVGKKLFGRNAGLLAAVILMFLPGQFLARSLLGFTDHHVAEVLFSVATVAILAYALDSAKKTGVSLEHFKNMDFKTIKEPLALAFLAGLAFSCYMLSWPGGLLIGFMMFLYFTIQCVFDHVKGKPLDSTVILASFFYIIPAILVLPYSLQYPSFDMVNWSYTQPVMLGLAFAGIWVIYAVSKLTENRAPRLVYPIALACVAAVGMLFFYVAAPSVYLLIVSGLNKFQASGGMLTVAEAHPSSLSDLWFDFNWNFYISIGALCLLAYRVYKDQRPAELMFLTWSAIMLWAAFTEIRFTYYFAVNVALLTAFFTVELFNLFGAQKFKENFVKRVKSLNDLPGFIGKYSSTTAMMSMIAVLFLIVAIWPVTGLGQNLTWAQAEGGPGGMQYEWYDALYWMSSHTPDPQGSPVQSSFDFANGTYAIPAHVGVDHYNYPSSAYGVMSWWDYGNDIEYVAHRLPNANPFQDGIIEQNRTTGAAPFFTSTDEDQSVKMLDALDSRYVIIDNEMATDGWISGKFGAIQVWVNDTNGWATQGKSSGYVWSDSQGSLYSGTSQLPIIKDTDKFNNSIMNRLYFEDCDDMSHYRLVYESAGSYIIDAKQAQLTQSNGGQYVQFTNGGGTMPMFQSADYAQANRIYNLYSKYVVSSDQQGSQYTYNARPPEKWVKIFELVKGATITGSAPDGSNVTATLTLKTDWGREFNYSATGTAANGMYSITVPYPTEQMKGPGYSYGIMPEGTYTVSIGNTTKNIAVSENAVMDGGNVQVS